MMNKFPDSPPQKTYPSITRTAFKSGMAYLSTLVLGCFFGGILAIAVAMFYMNMIDMGNIESGVISRFTHVITHPKILFQFLITLLLFCFIFVYGALSVFYSWQYAFYKAVETNSRYFSDRLASPLANYLLSNTTSKNKLTSIKQYLTDNAISKNQTSTQENSFWTRKILYFAIKQLPWGTLLSDYEKHKEAHWESDKQSLTDILSSFIGTALNELASPTWIPLILGVLAHIMLFGIGVWLN